MFFNDKKQVDGKSSTASQRGVESSLPYRP